MPTLANPVMATSYRPSWPGADPAIATRTKLRMMQSHSAAVAWAWTINPLGAYTTSH
jgi:hypothetical protein